MPTAKVIKKCKICGHHEYGGGCRLVSALCANTPSKPSFVKPEDMCKEITVLKKANVLPKQLRSPFCNIANKEGKEFDYGTFSGKARALKTSKDEADIRR